MSGLFADATIADATADAARNPALSGGTTPGEAFWSANEAYQRNSSLFAQKSNETDVIQKSLDQYHELTGENLRNPMLRPGWETPDQQRTNQANDFQAIRDKFAAKSKELGRPDLAFPSDEEIAQGSVALSRQALQRQASLTQGQQNFGAGVAGAAGGLAANVTDPVNAIAIGALPPGGNLVRSMLGAAAVFGGSAPAQDVATYGYKKAVTPEYGPGDVAANVAESALGGAAFELGGKLIGMGAGALWRRIKTTQPALADAMPRPVADAGNVAERVADLDANNPFKTGASGESAHNAAVVSVERDLAADRDPQLPPAVQAETEAPQIAPPSPEALDRHAATLRPELYQRVWSLESDMAQARSALDEVLSRPAAEPASGTASRLAELQDELAGYTGKRRASPSAQAVRDEIESLRSGEGEIAEDAAQQSKDQETFLRLRLNDLQQQRAALGPEVRAAREQAAQTIGLAPDAAATVNARTPPEAPAQPHVYDAPDLLAQAAAHKDRGVQRVAGALTDAMPEWGAMRAAARQGAIKASQDITADLVQAVRAIVKSRQEGLNVGEIMNRGPVFHSDAAQLAARLFYKDQAMTELLGRKAMRDNLSTFANEVRAAGADSEMFPVKQREAPAIAAANENVAALTTAAAKTGVPAIDAVLDSEPTRSIINNPKIDWTHDVPYGAGAARDVNNPLVNIDRHFPKQLTTASGVTYSPAEPFVIHEAVERRVMQILLDAGWSADRAYQTAHYGWAQVAEHSWYRSHGIDPAQAEAAEKPFLDQIQHENPANPSPDLYAKPYPHNNVRDAAKSVETEPKPTAKELAQARELVMRWAAEQPERPPVAASVAPAEPRIASLIRAATTPEAIEKAIADPAVHAAAEADLVRAIEQGQNRVPIADASGNVSLGFADKELHDLDRQVSLAKEIEACTVPVAEAAE
ncbi:MAG: hypothetical protein ACHQAY_12830 [Hyphomicrobiales bacterium]